MQDNNLATYCEKENVRRVHFWFKELWGYKEP